MISLTVAWLADMKGAEPGAMPRQSRLLKIQYAAITAMKNDMRSAMPAMAARRDLGGMVTVESSAPRGRAFFASNVSPVTASLATLMLNAIRGVAALFMG